MATLLPFKLRTAGPVEPLHGTWLLFYVPCVLLVRNNVDLEKCVSLRRLEIRVRVMRVSILPAPRYI